MYNLTASDGIADMSTNPTQRLERLLELTRGLNATQDTDSYLQMLISSAIELTDSETASILQYDDAGDHLRFVAVPPDKMEILAPARVPLDTSAAGWVVRHCAPLIMPDVSRDDRHYRQVDALSGFQTRSILAVPLKHHDRAVGAFEVLNKANEAHYTEEDLIILEMLAELACSALENDLLEKRVIKSLQETTELDRLKRDFIGITSHELRTPLGLILGHATFLRELLDSPYHEHVDTIIRNADRLKEIIEGLATLDDHENRTARLRTGMVSISQLARDTAAAFQEFARHRNISLEAAPGNDELLVQADGNKIAIALGNLVKNALTFTEENGHVRITAQAVPGYVKVSVIDDGIGIPAAALPHVFERFYQVESHLTRRYGGMGLGLSVARDMIEMHGGQIWAESEQGSGSNFSFLLPREAPAPQESAPPFLS